MLGFGVPGPHIGAVFYEALIFHSIIWRAQQLKPTSFASDFGELFEAVEHEDVFHEALFFRGKIRRTQPLNSFSFAADVGQE